MMTMLNARSFPATDRTQHALSRRERAVARGGNALARLATIGATTAIARP